MVENNYCKYTLLCYAAREKRYMILTKLELGDVNTGKDGMMVIL